MTEISQPGDGVLRNASRLGSPSIQSGCGIGASANNPGLELDATPTHSDGAVDPDLPDGACEMDAELMAAIALSMEMDPTLHACRNAAQHVATQHNALHNSATTGRKRGRTDEDGSEEATLLDHHVDVPTSTSAAVVDVAGPSFGDVDGDSEQSDALVQTLAQNTTDMQFDTRHATSHAA